MGTIARPFRERLREAAHYAGIEYSQTEIANSLGTTKQTVDRWMADGEPRPAMIFKIADKWGVDARWLATDEGHIVPPAGGAGLRQDELELIKGYRKATAPHRLSLRVMAKSLSKAIVVLALSIPFLPRQDAEASTLHKIFIRDDQNTHMRTFLTMLYALIGGLGSRLAEL